MLERHSTAMVIQQVYDKLLFLSDLWAEYLPAVGWDLLMKILGLSHF